MIEPRTIRRIALITGPRSSAGAQYAARRLAAALPGRELHVFFQSGPTRSRSAPCTWSLRRCYWRWVRGRQRAASDPCTARHARDLRLLDRRLRAKWPRGSMFASYDVQAAAAALDALRGLRPDLMLVFGGPKLPAAVLACAPRAWNIHGGRLPDYRGTASALFALAAGDVDAVGVTLHVAAEQLDAGDVIAWRPVALPADGSLPTLMERIYDGGLLLALDAIAALDGGAETPALTATPQDGDVGLYRAAQLDESVLRAAYATLRAARRPRARRDEPLRVMLINTDYDAFLADHYAQHPQLAAATYDEQMRARLATRFGIGDALSNALAALGCEARDAFLNNWPMQRAWAREHGAPFRSPTRWEMRVRGGLAPWPVRVRDGAWMHDILAAQIAAFRPHVLYSLVLESIDSAFLRRVRDDYGVAVLQHAAMIPPRDFSAYDLVLSSLPNLVSLFRAHGLAAEHAPLAFDARVLDDPVPPQRDLDVVFVGGLVGVQHAPGARLLDALCERFDVAVWGPSLDGAPRGARVRRAYRGPLWGRGMYDVFRRAKIVINRHGPIADGCANNMRLYEATGCGALLVTEAAKGLDALFTPGAEVATYTDEASCINRVAYFLEHDAERARVAAAGQARTLREHTYTRRARAVLGLIEPLARGESARAAPHVFAQ